MRPKSYENKIINFIKLEKNWFKKKDSYVCMVRDITVIIQWRLER